MDYPDTGLKPQRAIRLALGSVCRDKPVETGYCSVVKSTGELGPVAYRINRR